MVFTFFSLTIEIVRNLKISMLQLAIFWWLQLLVRWLDFPTNSTHSEAWHLDKNDHLEGIGFGGFFFQLAIFKFIAGILGMYSHVYIRSRHFLFIIWHFPQLMTLIWCRLLMIFNIFKKIFLCRPLFENLTLIIMDYGDFDLAGYFEYSIYFATSLLR